MTVDYTLLEHQCDREDAEARARMEHPDALRNAALFYARAGLAVFPLRPGNKMPLIPSAHPNGDPLRGLCKGECGQRGHGLYDATTNPDTITRWWNRAPQANVGLRTGLLFDVLDCDGPPGYYSLGVVRESGVLPPTFGYVVTGRLGAHLYIRPTGGGNGASLGPGLDYRGASGYVVAPPSISSDTGNRWTWTTPLDLEGLKA